VESRPKTPALAAATQRLLLLKGPMPAWMMGYLIPTMSQSLDLIIGKYSLALAEWTLPA
jgi:hypothetical protein